MAAQVFLALLYYSQWPSKIGPTADFDGAAIPPPIIYMCLLFMLNSISIDLGMVPVGSETTQMRTPPLRKKKLACLCKLSAVCW